MRSPRFLVAALAIAASTAQAADPPRPPKVWAILVGIDAYDDPAIPACRGASGDARAIRRWLVENAGWAGAQILSMDASAPSAHGLREQEIAALRPTRANLDWAVREWLAYRVRPGDVVLISFGGQAIGGRDGDPGSRDVLLPIDARADNLDGTGWAIQDALDPLASAGDNPVLVWIDSAMGGRGTPAAGMIGRRSSAARFLLELTRWPGVSAWIAADPGPSTEPPDARTRGPFVATILDAMGTKERPGNILGAIFALNREPRLSGQGVRTAGGLGPEWSLWPGVLASLVRPPEELLLQRGHSDRVTAVAFSPDGATTITASMDSTIKAWRTADRVLLRNFPAHTIGVTALALSPDASRLASGDGAGRVILWDLATLRPLRFQGPPPHDRGIVRMAFLDDGSGFASLDLGGRTVAWDARDGRLTPTNLAEGASALASGRDLFAVAGGDGDAPNAIRLFDRSGKALRTLAGPGGFIAPGGLAIRAGRVAAGDKGGSFGLWDLVDGKILARVRTDDPIVSVDLTDRVAVAASGRSALLLWTDRPFAPVKLDLGGPAGHAVLTEDGRALAAATTAGAISAWDLSAPDAIASVPIAQGAGSAPSTVLAVSPRARLVSGDQDGGVRFWDWPSGKPIARIAPHRGKVDALAVSPDGRHLAQIDHDRNARVWDLREGRDLRTIPGAWLASAFLPDGQALAMTRADGSVGVVDLATLRPRPAAFHRPERADGAGSTWGFSTVTPSPDGTMVAAGSPHGPLACVWPITGGVPLWTIRGHQDAISAVDFSADSRTLLTASLDGSAKVWPIGADRPRWELLPPEAEDEGADPAVTSARTAPGGLARVATGHRDGRVFLWDLGAEARPKAVPLGRFEGPVHSLAFTPDGASLIAGSGDKTVRLWRLDGPAPRPAARRFEPQHSEQVNAVVAWPGGNLLATAGDDATIRFWHPEGPRPLGTLALEGNADRWVAYTPDGRYDSAPGGEALVSFTRADRVLNLEQSGDDARVFGLGTLWLDGKDPGPRSSLLVSRPPPLWIAPPIPVRGGEVDVVVRLPEAGLENLRLYLNDRPVRDESDFRATDDPMSRVVSVRLAPGENRLVAMASRPGPGTVHGRSNEVRVDGPPPGSGPLGVVHSLALGISDYDKSPLRFADRDADDMAAFLARNGVGEGGRSGLKLVLRNDQVTPSAVETSLLAIRERARPEDTVVIFLAGHTDVRRERFLLLLQKFPFAPGAVDVGQRGPIGAQAGPREDPSTVIPYATIYRLLARMDALKRLVVIDACQAEAIFDDLGVRRIQDKVDDGAHRARTSYLLASRRGEAANESSVLRHGLFTHLLLRGMGATDLAAEPGGALGHADADGDGLVTTEELRQFVATNLPILSRQVSLAGARANAGVAPPPERATPLSATSAFPLVQLPR